MTVSVSKVFRILMTAVLAPAALYAQSIAGVVRDASNAVLPGVTVEAASPALIEKVRVAVSDSTGQYRIENLRPGMYTVTFSLTGFRTVRRDGLELTGSLTFGVNAEMQLGAVEETVIVTGESPIVDVQTAQRQSVVQREVITALPTSGGYEQILRLAPGVIGGAQDIAIGARASTFSAHGAFLAGRGNHDGRTMLDGLLISVPQGTSSNAFTDTRNAEEVTLTVSGGLGEYDTAGPALNIVPRTGSNVLSASTYVDWMNRRMQGNNVSDTLRAAGAIGPTPVHKNYDLNGALGGPIVRDRLWFFFSARKQYFIQDINMYHNKNAGDPTKWTYEPDFSRVAVNEEEYHNTALRLTTQVTPRNKLSLFWDETYKCKRCVNEYVPLSAPEASRRGDQWPIQISQVTWTSPVSNRVLVDAAFGAYRTIWTARQKHDPYTGDLVRMVEQCTAGCPNNGGIAGLTYRSLSNDLRMNGRNRNGVYSWRASIAHVSGSRTFKAGYTGNMLQDRREANQAPNNLNYRVNNGIPNQFTMFINKYPNTTWMRADGVFAQQAWTRDRLSLQGALRFDIAQSWAPPQQVGPARFMPTPLVFPHTPIVDSYKDLSPRAAATYDLFGTGKTALKASWGMYLESTRTGGPYTVGNPTSRIAQTVSRSWTDANGNFNPDCELLNPVAQDLRASGGDFCGAFSDLNFGTATFSNSVDPDLLKGWGVRPADRQLTVSVQHEVAPRVSVDVGYVRRSFLNFMVTDNLAVGPADFDTFSIVAPSDNRLPDGGGYTISGLYNVKPAFFGRTNNFITLSDKYGDQSVVFNGVDLTVVARLRQDLTFQGGSNWGRTTSDTCEVQQQLPETAPLDPYCHVVSGYLPYFKGAGTYVVPHVDVQLGVSFTSRPGLKTDLNGTPQGGAHLAANYSVSNAVVAQSLGRNLSGNAANVTVNVLEPGLKYGDRTYELNLRIGKILRFGRARANVGVDILNLLNVAPVLGYNEAFIPGGSWLSPLQIMKARFVKIGMQLDL
jgi:hypothetical protein